MYIIKFQNLYTNFRVVLAHIINSIYIITFNNIKDDTYILRIVKFVVYQLGSIVMIKVRWEFAVKVTNERFG